MIGFHWTPNRQQRQNRTHTMDDSILSNSYNEWRLILLTNFYITVHERTNFYITKHKHTRKRKATQTLGAQTTNNGLWIIFSKHLNPAKPHHRNATAKPARNLKSHRNWLGSTRISLVINRSNLPTDIISQGKEGWKWQVDGQRWEGRRARTADLGRDAARKERRSWAWEGPALGGCRTRPEERWLQVPAWGGREKRRPASWGASRRGSGGAWTKWWWRPGRVVAWWRPCPGRIGLNLGRITCKAGSSWWNLSCNFHRRAELMEVTALAGSDDGS
jgi:hypothetical protein